MRLVRRLPPFVVVLLAAAACTAAETPVGTTELISRPAGFGPFSLYNGLGDATAGNTGRAQSSDGRYVVFTSDANGMEAGVMPDRYVNCYLRDTVAETTVLLDRRVGRPEAADSLCHLPSISGDGSVVVFGSDANLLVPGDLDGLSDLFIWDRGHVTALGVPAGAPNSPDVTVTGAGDSRTVHVAFSTVERLVDEDTNDLTDVYVRSLGAEPGTVLVSRAAGPGTPAVGGYSITITGDARRAAFVTRASLDAADTGDDEDVYVRDLASDTVTYASRPTGTGGQQSDQTYGAVAEIARDGSAVAFLTNASNMGGSGIFNIKGVVAINRLYVRRLTTNETFPMAVADGSTTALSPYATDGFSVSDDGSRVAFATWASGPGWAEGPHVYVRDVGSTVTTPAQALSDAPESLVPREERIVGLSGDGTKIVFGRTDPSLGYRSGTAYMQVWQRDLPGGPTRKISRPDGPADARFVILRGGDSSARGRSVSAGGRWVVFTSENDVLTAGSAVGPQVYLRDRETGDTRLLSGAGGTSWSDLASISADGGTVAFRTSSPALEGMPVGRSVISVWRRATDDIRTLSAPADSVDAPSLTSDGRLVVFMTPEERDTRDPHRVWLGDTDSGVVSPVLDAAGAPLDLGTSSDAAVISGDGSRIAFSTSAPLVQSDTDGWADVYVLDRPSGAITRVSGPDDRSPDATLAAARPTSLNGDGSVVAYDSSQLSPSSGMWTNGVVRVLSTRELLPPGASWPTFVHSGGTLLSDDGRRAATTVPPEGLPPEWDSAAPLMVVRDLVTGAFTAVSRGDGANGVLAVSESIAGGDPLLDFVTFSTGWNVQGIPYRTDGFRDLYLRRVFGPPPAASKPRRTLARVSVTARLRSGGRPVVRFTLGVAGPVRLTVQRAVAGRVLRGRCRAGARVGRRCTVWTTLQRRRVMGRTGANTVRLAPRRVAGRYRVRVAVTGGPARVIPFRVVRAPAR